MPLTDIDYNNFSTTLTERFAERCKGLDDGSRRVVDGRPADHILVGFLTPVQDGQGVTTTGAANQGVANSLDDADADEDLALADDLPRDSAYEQTALGLEWIAPLEYMRDDVTVDVDINLCVYVRRLPTFAEQNRRIEWNWQPAAGGTRTCNMIQAWSRETLPRMRVSFNMGRLRRERRLAETVSDQVQGAWGGIDNTNLYPGRQAITIQETDLTSPDAYGVRLAALQSSGMPVDWNPVIDIRLISMPTEPGCVRVALRAINQTTKIKDKYLDYVDPNLYAVNVRVSLPRELHRMAIFQELPASFRYDREMYGVGINAHVDGRVDGPQLILETDSVPVKRVNRLEPQRISGADPRFDELATTPLPILRAILDAMRGYDADKWRETVESLGNDVERQDAEEARKSFMAEIGRFERGVNLLADEQYPNVRRAFSLMNRTMEKAARGAYDEWRLFQIVFIVSQLPALAAREHPELATEDDDKVEILWFAAGGGKTEGFLGLILWQVFFDRLRGKAFGVSAFVRFPLRLLAFQQLQRLSRALAAAEVIRVEENLGGTRFSIGDFVGGNVTPNRIDTEEHNRFSRRGVDKRYQRIFECPFCDSEVKLAYDSDLRLIKHVCTNATCIYKDRLPIYIVDYDIYRFLPTVIVSTVDKIALLGFNQRFANIFGRFDLVCPHHGASFNNTNKFECSAAKAFGEGGRPAQCEGKTVWYAESRPFHDPAPALLIQDELHLLSEDLGAFDAHYETGVMELARSLGFKPWKIIAATATIEEYEQHSRQLYLKRARQFPGPGPKAYESFYYREEPDKIGRIFVGILGIGRKHTPAVTRTLSILYLEIQAARDLAATDLVAATARYRTGPLTKEEFKKLIFLYELPLTYVLTRKGSDQVAEAIESRVKKELQELSPNHGDLKIDMFNSGVDIAEMSETMQRISTDTPDGEPSERVRGLVTTNIIGHGVDIDRFNIIVFAGFTRLVAEYIQASARVGRTYPGLSILVATPQNERDRSIFDRFAKFHEYLDRLVDPSAVTRWTDPALQRTVPGLLAGYLMGVASYRLAAAIASVENVQRHYARAGAEALNESEIAAWIERAYGTDQAPSPERYRERVANWVSNTYRLVINATTYPGGKPRQLGDHLGAMRSLRDIDDPAEVRPARPTDEEMIRRIING
jgi:hypothetical protein